MNIGAMAILAAIMLAPTPVMAEETAPVPDPRPHVAIVTTAGTLILRLEDGRAPISAANFLRYVDAGRYVGEPFYRTSRNWGPGSGFIQAGVRSDARKHFPPIAHEPTNQTGLTHCAGAISFARGAPGSATSDIFIMLDAIASFDAAPPAEPPAADQPPADTAGYAAFAEVVAGWDVVQAIYGAEVAPDAGEGVMRGQLLAAPVRITATRRIAPTAVPTTAVPAPAIGCLVKNRATPTAP